MSSELLISLEKAKVLFQQRAIMVVMGISMNEANDNAEEVYCDICGDYHEVGCVPYACETGDGI